MGYAHQLVTFCVSQTSGRRPVQGHVDRYYLFLPAELSKSVSPNMSCCFPIYKCGFFRRDKSQKFALKLLVLHLLLDICIIHCLVLELYESYADINFQREILV